MTRRPSRGGILFDFFLIVVVLIGGVTAWLTRDSWGPSAWGKFEISNPFRGVKLPRRVTPAPVRPPAETGDLARRFLVLLERQGIEEKDVLKMLNEQKGAAPTAWVESTLEVRASAGFSSEQFLRAAAPVLRDARVGIRSDVLENGRWQVEFGDRQRVYHRLIVHLN